MTRTFATAAANAERVNRFHGATSGLLQRKCACREGGGAGDKCAGELANSSSTGSAGHDFGQMAVQPKLNINEPGDRFEQEADRMADLVANGATAVGESPVSSLGGPSVQRDGDDKQKPPKPNNYDEAAKKIGDAFLETKTGKKLKGEAEELGEEFLSSVEGKVVAGSTLGTALAVIIATNSELPVPIPEIPLDFIKPGLKAKLTYEGPVQNPTNVGLTLTSKGGLSVSASYSQTAATTEKPAETKAGLTLTIPLGSSPAKPKSKESTDDKYRAETARIAADQRKFREGLKTPAQKVQEERGKEAFLNSYFRYRSNDPLNPLNVGKKKDDFTLMRKAATGSAGIGPAPPIVHETLAGSGRPLDSNTRTFMEARFGHDFSRVRIHTDAKAAESARAVNAHAYTVGHNIVFGTGQYSPNSHAGKRLLSHELTHVVQQSGRDAFGTGHISRKPGPSPKAPITPGPAIVVTNGWANPAGKDDRTTVGIGELNSFVVNDVAGGRWRSADGNGTTVNSVTFRWTASTAGTNTITYMAANKASSSVTMTTLVPSRLKAKNDGDLTYPAGTQGAGMNLIVTTEPTNVSFQALEVMEGTCNSSAISGYFTKHRPGPHDASAGAGTWNQLGPDNDAPDTADSSGWPAPWSKGSYTWAIPASWRLAGAKTATPFRAKNNQIVTITGSDGTTIVTKLGARTTPRKP